MPGKSAHETLEDMAMTELGKGRDKAGRIAERALGMDNHAVIIPRVGAKGSLINVTQMVACIGQTALRGKRILRGYTNKALPHFREDDISPKARGFIGHSYKQGLTPIEYFFHSMSGRDALVDKGIRTARSGYMQRRLINALLDILLMQDRTVRDSSGTIIQFVYGEDGADPQKCEKDRAVDVDKYL
jgi:DNA-directed RNA polymerase subunit A'